MSVPCGPPLKKLCLPNALTNHLSLNSGLTRPTFQQALQAPQQQLLQQQKQQQQLQVVSLLQQQQQLQQQQLHLQRVRQQQPLQLQLQQQLRSLQVRTAHTTAQSVSETNFSWKLESENEASSAQNYVSPPNSSSLAPCAPEPLPVGLPVTGNAGGRKRTYEEAAVAASESVSAQSWVTVLAGNKESFVEYLVDNVVEAIENIWPNQNDHAIPLRYFVREALRRSKTSFWTLQTAYVYLVRARTGLNAYGRSPNANVKQQNQCAAASVPASMSRIPSPTASLPQFCERVIVKGNPVDAAAHYPTPKLTPEALPQNASATASPGTSEVSSPQAFETTQIDPTQCGRRMFIAALMVASKYLRDRNYSNKAWASLSGLGCKEVNRIEINFLKLISYRLHVSLPVYARCSAYLFRHMDQKTLQKKLELVKEAKFPTVAATMGATLAPMMNSSNQRVALVR